MICMVVIPEYSIIDPTILRNGNRTSEVRILFFNYNVLNKIRVYLCVFGLN